MAGPSLCFITDSLGLDAAVGQPESSSISYIQILESQYQQVTGECLSVTRDSLTGRTSKMVLELQEEYNWSSFQKIFLHVGIVDCSPRVLTAFQRRLLSILRPLFLRDLIIKFIGKLHVRWFFKYFPYPVLVSQECFKKNLHDFITCVQKNSKAEIYLISISPTTDAKEYTYVGLSEKIERYNAVLRSVSIESGAKYLDFYNYILLKRNEVVYDGVHLNKEGKELLARFIVHSIAAVDL